MVVWWWWFGGGGLVVVVWCWFSSELAVFDGCGKFFGGSMVLVY